MIRVIITALALCACTPERSFVAEPIEPIAVAIPTECTTPCASLPPWRADAADGSALWDTLGEQQIDIAEQHARCEAARASCAAVLRRLERVRVITSSAGR